MNDSDRFTELGHLGDGVYLSFDGIQFWLAVNHHTNKVVALEPEILLNLIRSVAQLFGDQYPRALRGIADDSEANL